MDLRATLEKVDSKDDLAFLVDQLREDLESNPGAWENADLASFLEAMSAWLRDMDGYYQNIGETVPASPTWKTIGEVLLAARIYE
jgi:hypothetical protein